MSATTTPVSPHERLRSSRDFRRVLACGVRASAGPLQCIVAPGETASTRVGVSVGRMLGKAIARNRVKRLLREVVRTMELPPSTDIVLVAKPAAVGKTFQEMKGLVAEALEKALARV